MRRSATRASVPSSSFDALTFWTTPTVKAFQFFGVTKLSVDSSFGCVSVTGFPSNEAMVSGLVTSSGRRVIIVSPSPSGIGVLFGAYVSSPALVMGTLSHNRNPSGVSLICSDSCSTL